MKRIKTIFDTELNGINHYSVTDCNGIYLAKVPENIKKGDIFNVYCFESTKFGCVWVGDLEDSLIKLALSDDFKKHKKEIYGKQNNLRKLI